MERLYSLSKEIIFAVTQKGQWGQEQTTLAGDLQQKWLPFWHQSLLEPLELKGQSKGGELYFSNSFFSLT